MSKPWDHMVNKESHIRPGEWETTGSVFVKLDRVYEGCVDICFEPTALPWAMDSRDLREFAEFCTKLADQLEPQ